MVVNHILFANHMCLVLMLVASMHIACQCMPDHCRLCTKIQFWPEIKISVSGRLAKLFADED